MDLSSPPRARAPLFEHRFDMVAIVLGSAIQVIDKLVYPLIKRPATALEIGKITICHHCRPLTHGIKHLVHHGYQAIMLRPTLLSL